MAVPADVLDHQQRGPPTSPMPYDEGELRARLAVVSSQRVAVDSEGMDIDRHRVVRARPVVLASERRSRAVKRIVIDATRLALVLSA